MPIKDTKSIVNWLWFHHHQSPGYRLDHLPNITAPKIKPINAKPTAFVKITKWLCTDVPNFGQGHLQMCTHDKCDQIGQSLKVSPWQQICSQK